MTMECTIADLTEHVGDLSLVADALRDASRKRNLDPDRLRTQLAPLAHRASSRDKDLVDLAVIALTQRIDGPALGHAIETESRRRRMHPLTSFEVPPSWGTRIHKDG